MSWVLILAAATWIAVERRRRRQLQATHDRELAAAVQMTASAYRAVIDDLTLHCAARLTHMAAEVLAQRRVDLVELYDRGLFVHRDGQVSELPGEVGTC